MKDALLVPMLFGLLLVTASDGGKAVSLFDGKTFTGWNGDTAKIWRIEDGAIVGGSLTKKIARNEFLATDKSYGDFVLKLKFKLLGDTKKNFVNSGVQIRSQRIPNNSEMIGYQCDLGDPTWWGSIYDESRRNKVMAQSDMKAVNQVLKRDDWNDYEIRAEGRRIRTYINGTLAVDYTEKDESLPQEGKIGMQVHSGGPAEAWFKDITIEELAPSGDSIKLSAAPPGKSPRSPAEQQKTFRLPEGYEIELVASEPAVGKPVSVAWDAKGRLWTMTALEYPLDANEDPQRAEELYRNGGRDRVLVFDQPYSPGPHEPRVFAEGLAIPLGLLPLGDGVLVQHGRQILRLRDTNGDGKADQREVFLDGFGIEDSHLFPHQFTRAPGGWLYFAQGAFNRSRVKTKEGPIVRMDFCKLARAQLDGSRFELAVAGLNNIWGLVISPLGEMFIQEANDLGYPVVPAELYSNYPGIGMEKLKPYAPWTPTIPHTFQMGGTGLSGLALRAGSHFGDTTVSSKETFYVANPITSRVQTVHLVESAGGKKLELGPDLLTSSDPWFRPVAIHFGPDDCLYVVDWYNAIISHNEVPRNHPDRDKSRGRIWRIRKSDQARRPVPDLTQATPQELVKYLGSRQPWEVTTAWQQLVDRQTKDVIPDLKALATSKASPGERLAALWALEGLSAASLDLLDPLLTEANPHLRREAVRVLGSQGFAENDIRLRLAMLASEPVPGVRAAVIRTLANIPNPTPETLLLLCQLGKEELLGVPQRLEQGGSVKQGLAHHRDFERYLVRVGLEKHPETLAALLASPTGRELPLEAQALAALALEPAASARVLGQLLPRLTRPPNEEELLRLLAFADRADTAQALPHVLGNPRVLQALLAQRSRLDPAKVRGPLTAATRELWDSRTHDDLASRLIASFELREMEHELLAALEGGSPPARKVAALKALRVLGCKAAAQFATLARQAEGGSPLRQEALLALAACPTNLCVPLLGDLFPLLNAQEKQQTLRLLASSAAGARAIVLFFKQEQVEPAFLDGMLVERLHAFLKDDAALHELLVAQGKGVQPVLLLEGGDQDFVDTPILLEGPFTVETWVRLVGNLSNADSILGRPGVACFNFAGGRFRVWAGPQGGDVAFAKKNTLPETWQHIAVTRDSAGRISVYTNGELDQHGQSCNLRWENLRIGHSNPPEGTQAAFAEFRVWDRALSPTEIRDGFDRALPDGAKPPGLKHRFGDKQWGPLQGNARVILVTEGPPLLSAVEAGALQAKFVHYRKVVSAQGDAAAGKVLFTKNCQNCHAVGGQGGQIGPTLTGVGVHGDETLLRHVLTPHAAMEPGYRMFRLELRSGVAHDGFLVRRDDREIVLRKPGEEDRRFDARLVSVAGFTRQSVMPDGLLDALKPQEVSDLFSYLRTLR